MEQAIKMKIIIESKGLKLFDSTSINEVKQILHFDYGTAMIIKDSVLALEDFRGRSNQWKVVKVQTQFYDKTQRESADYNSEQLGAGSFDAIIHYEVEPVKNG